MNRTAFNTIVFVVVVIIVVVVVVVVASIGQKDPQDEIKTE